MSGGKWNDGWDRWEGYYRGGDRPRYVDAKARERRAQEALAKLGKTLGREPQPVAKMSGRDIAKSFWGKAWCENLERYSDYETRLPRGRSYVRSGAVLDLWISPCVVDARVSGTELYEVRVTFKRLATATWDRIREETAGKIDSLVELLRGQLPPGVMEAVTRREMGLFPSPREISFTCSCPDAAKMCKHVAAVLYGIGARLDAKPELLFQLRDADPSALVTHETVGWLTLRNPSSRRLDERAVSSIFGVTLVPDAPPRAEKRARRPAKPAAKKRRPRARAKPRRGKRR